MVKSSGMKELVLTADGMLRQIAVSAIATQSDEKQQAATDSFRSGVKHYEKLLAPRSTSVSFQGITEDNRNRAGSKASGNEKGSTGERKEKHI